MGAIGALPITVPATEKPTSWGCQVGLLGVADPYTRTWLPVTSMQALVSRYPGAPGAPQVTTAPIGPKAGAAAAS
ncbi:hypothetical protein [Kitasatospora sp. P5_F3]